MGYKFYFKHVPDMSELIFPQDGARPHTALRTRRLLEENIPLFWTGCMWLGNSPDLSPIENFWSILGDKLKQVKVSPSNIVSLVRALLTAWKRIPQETQSDTSCSKV